MRQKHMPLPLNSLYFITDFTHKSDWTYPLFGYLQTPVTNCSVMYARLLRMTKVLKNGFKYNPNWYFRNILQNILICIDANFMDFIKNWGNITNSYWANVQNIYIPLVETSDFLNDCFGIIVCVCASCSVVSDTLLPRELWPTRFLCPRGFSRHEYWVGCRALLLGIFPTQGLKPGLLQYRRILYHLSHQGSPLVLYLLNKNIYSTIYSPSIHRFSARFTKPKVALSSVTSFNIIQPHFKQKHVFRFKFLKMASYFIKLSLVSCVHVFSHSVVSNSFQLHGL